MKAIRTVVGICAVLAAAAAVVAVAAMQPAIDPIKPPAAGSFDPTLIKRGAELAALGNCDACHTAPGGKAFAGGLAIPTPFGTIYSTNITPDAGTGIGGWSEAAFQRAMRKGVRRDGAYLYPAFPYDHFTLVTDDDNKALYAYLMTREPVSATPPANTLSFPYNVRSAMSGWNTLFLRRGPYRADPAQSEAFNRGAYLAEGLGHCGACHTPRNFLGAEQGSKKFAGGAVEGWTAYALDAASPAPEPWSADALFHYLHFGFDETHGVARGPMKDVADRLRTVPPDDVRAIATYVAAQMGHTGPPQQRVAQQADLQAQRGKAVAAATADSQANVPRAADAGGGEGAVIYTSACAGCHQGPRAVPYGGIDLALSSGVSGPNADNLVNVVLYGLPASAGTRSAIMPGFAAILSDAQVVALANYLRSRFSDRPPWTDVDKSVRDAGAGRSPVTASQAATQ